MDFTAIDAGCCLTDPNIPIPVGRSREEILVDGTPLSYVPFRNGIFLAYAVALGEVEGIENIYAGANGLNSGNYWDDTTAFASKFTAAARTGTSQEYNPTIRFPFARWGKKKIVALGKRLGIDYEKETWSCYVGGKTHCGICDSCVQRMDALG